MTDSRGIIWVDNKYGIVLYQKTPFQLTTNQMNDGMSTHDVVSLNEYNKGNVWASTHSGLLYIQVTYNNGALSYKVSGFNREDGLVGHACNPNAMYKDLKGHIYVGTTKGVVEIDPERMIVNEQKPEAKFTALFLNNKEITSGMLLSGRMVMDDHISSAKKITLPYNQTNFTLNFSSFNYIRPGKCQFRYLLRGLDNEYVTLPRGTHSQIGRAHV